MWKKLVVILMVVMCCYCEENSTVVADEGRAKKIKKKSLRLLAMIAIFVLSKIAIFKVATFFFFFAFFQKLFSIGGVLLTYFMKTQLGLQAPPPPAPSVAPVAPVAPPSTSYGSPTDYNTIGYSYGPPDHEAAFQSEGSSLPGIDLGGPYSWILSRP